jgi:hypothetical protein
MLHPIFVEKINTFYCTQRRRGAESKRDNLKLISLFFLCDSAPLRELNLAY